MGPLFDFLKVERIELTLFLLALGIDITWIEIPKIASFLILVQMAFLIILSVSLHRYVKSYKINLAKATKKKRLSFENIITGSQLLIIYTLAIKLISSMSGTQNWFEVSLELDVLIFLIFASYILFPILRETQGKNMKKLDRKMIASLLGLMVFIFLVKNSNVLGIDFSGIQINLITHKVAGVNYAIIILVIQFATKFTQRIDREHAGRSHDVIQKKR